ncbi:MAG: AAA family ATPase [Treponemataceae bacterium]|nr:AAA family ATPase [Treponemataceae bacterium]
MDLFESAVKKSEEGPLASRMRPRNLDEYIGQDHIVGKGRLLRRAIAADQLTSVIFYGPPGTGKTTLARVIANHTKSNFITLNAVLTGVQNIRDAISKADEQRKLYNRRTILFVDEVHRWNKSQQDALLPWVENGTIILVGATTENPFFEVNKALVSRSRVFQLKPLTAEDLHKAVMNAISDRERGYGRWQVQFEEGALEHLIDTANGDARSLLNALELAVETTPEKWSPNTNPPEPPEGSLIFISKETAEESIQKKVVLYDRDGDYHYDIISAFIKSLRGRDPDAALYWMARMMSAGEDPHFIFRRMLISACEDTGLADPNALTVVESCAAAFDRIGLPEGQYMLTQAALYLATAPKSNSSMAYFDALSAVRKEDAEVPNHLRDSSRDSEGFGHGAGYLYPHAYRDHWVPQQYLPDGLEGRVFYNPCDQGYEKSIRNEVLSRRELQITALLEDSLTKGADWEGGMVNSLGGWWGPEHLRHGDAKTGENLTFSPGGSMLEHFQKRTDEGRSEFLLFVRNTLIDSANPLRHSRNLVYGADDGLFVWELLRRSPEGFTCGLCFSDRGREILEHYGSTLDEIDRPAFVSDLNTLGDVQFDNVFARDPFTDTDSVGNFCGHWQEMTGSNECFSARTGLFIAQKLPAGGQRLSSAIKAAAEKKCIAFSKAEKDALNAFADAEDAFYSQKNHPLFGWNAETVAAAFEKHGFACSIQTKESASRRVISSQEAARWFDSEHSPYAAFMAEKLSLEQMETLRRIFSAEVESRTVFDWKVTTLFIKAGKPEKPAEN